MATTSISSDIKSSSGSIATGRNRINAITIGTDGTNGAVVTLYDNPSAASGKILAWAACPGPDVTKTTVFVNPVLAENGIYASMLGIGAQCIIHYGG